MRAFIAVFEREVVERRLLFAASLLLALVPLAAPWIPGLAQRGGPELRSAVALILAVCFSFGLALILGATVVARDLAESRLAFYFSRPVPGWAVWAGKLSAAAALALSAGVLILAPATAVDRRLDLGSWWDGRVTGTAGSLLLWLAGVVLLAVLGHAASVALRSRSPWLLLDFVGLGVIAWLAWTAMRRLFFAGAFGAAFLAGTAVAALGAAAFLAAGAVQVVKGRTDLRRGHRLLSLTLWVALLAASLSAQGYAAWVLAAEPKDLDEVGLSELASESSWIAIFGPAAKRADYRPEFLLDTASGRFARVRFFLPPRFTSDGRWAVWLEPESMQRYTGSYELLRLDLRDPESRPERTRMTYLGRFPPMLAVSQNGRLAAIANGRRLTIEEVPSGRLLAAADLPRELDPAEDALLFVAPGKVRIFDYETAPQIGAELIPGALVIRELEVGGGGLMRTEWIEQIVQPQWNFLLPIGQEPRHLEWIGQIVQPKWNAGDLWLFRPSEISADGARLLVRRSDHRYAVFDAGSGSVLAELPPAGERSRASFLADGRIALVSGSRPKELRIFARDFVLERSFRFADAAALRLGGQPAPDRLVVATSPKRSGTWKRNEALILDLATSSVRRLGDGLVPMPYSLLGPESAGARLFWRDGISRLVQVDLATGRERVVAGRIAG
jgi:hypothetical protein